MLQTMIVIDKLCDAKVQIMSKAWQMLPFQVSCRLEYIGSIVRCNAYLILRVKIQIC